MKFLFFLLPLVFFLQTRIPIANQFHGNDYEIIFVYVRDIVVLGFTGIGLHRHGQLIWRWLLQRKWVLYWFILLFLFSIVSSITALDSVVAVYKTANMVLYCVFAVTLGWYISTENNLSSWLRWWAIPFLCIVGMAAYEVITGQSMSLWIVGNWDYSILTPGIARAQFFGISFLRPYTVFPHPNVLGGIALVFGILFISLSGNNMKKSRLIRIGILSTWFLTLVSFSRSAWIAGVVGLVLALFAKRRNIILSRSVLIAVVVSLLVIIPYVSQISAHDPAISERVELIARSIDMIQKDPLLGVGNGNFTIALKEFRSAERQILLQPVHVVWLLVASELGIIAGIIYAIGWLGVLRDAVRSSQRTIALFVGILWCAMGIISLADHYWWSLSVGNAVWWLMLGISLSVIQSKQQL